MPSNDRPSPRNPLAGLVTDDEYAALEAHDLLSERGLRDYLMRETFRTLREADVPAADALDLLHREHPYLQHDTIRKIVYAAPRRA